MLTTCKRLFERAVLMAVVLTVGVSLASAAADKEFDLQSALDKVIGVSAKAPIGEVFDQIAAAAGVKFVIAPEAFDALPYGRQTQLTITFKNATLRKDLTQLLAKQALRWSIHDDAVLISPSPALKRMARRASVDELNTLGMMHLVDIEPTAQAGSAVVQLRKIVGDDELKVSFRVAVDQAEAIQRADLALPCTGAEWADMLCRDQQWTWYLDGSEIVVVDAQTQVIRQLQKQISLSYTGADILDALRELADSAGVSLRMAPGVLQYLPADMRTSFNLVMAKASIEQALAVISGATGLKFTPSANGIRIDASDELKEGPRKQNRKRVPFFVKMSLPDINGAKVEIFFRGSELPDDLIEKILEEKKGLIETLRMELIEEQEDAETETK